MAVLGIDEAGRGPVIGPMVVAGCLIDEDKIENLQAMDIKDSKLIAPAKREYLFDKVKKAVKAHKILVIQPDEIDAALASEELNLNWLEAQQMIKIIAKLKPGKAILDCPSTNINAFNDYVKERLPKGVGAKVISEHKADAKHTIVGAASILAKVTRDREIEKLKEKFDVDFGSGYPSDPKTIEFLRDNWDKYDFFRRSWGSWKKVKEAMGQSDLGSWMKK